MNFNLQDIIDNLAGRAINEAVNEVFGRGERHCPRDGDVLVRLPSGMYFCESCTTKWAPFNDARPSRGQPLGGSVRSADEDAFRPFNPFIRERQTRRSRRTDDYQPPRPYRRPRPAPPPPPQPRQEDVISEAYQLLGLSPGADRATVKSARRKLALIHHPDRGGEKDTLARINAAADLLLEIL